MTGAAVCRRIAKAIFRIVKGIFKIAKAIKKIATTVRKKVPENLTTAIQMWYLCSVRFMNQQTLKCLSSRGASATKDLVYIHVYASEILPPYGRLNDN